MLEKHARRLARLGLRVFPCEPLGKRPLTESGVHAASRKRGVIHRWWSNRPNANIGVALPCGIFALDIDAQSGGYETLHRLEREHGMLTPDTVLAMTPSGGMHYLFRYPDDLPVGNSAGRVGRGIDTRGDGGYIVVAPSEIVTKDGEIKSYRWVHAPWEIKIAPAPKWLIRLARRKPKAVQSSGPFTASMNTRALAESIVKTVLTKTEGERNDTLYWASCRFGELIRAGRLSQSEALATLVEAGARAGLSEQECERTAYSGMRRVGAVS
jgi:bifunctional DNA primase/polymerase-like protein